MTATPISTPDLTVQAKATREAARHLAVLPEAERNQAVEAIAQSLEAHAAEIIAANEEDRRIAEAEGLAKALYGRLKLDAEKLSGAIAGVRDVAKLPDPLGRVQIHRELDNGLLMKRITCPLGVLGVIFESRPDALVQIATLAVKSGNGVILKGGREAIRSCEALTQAIHAGLTSIGIDPAVVRLLTTREETMSLLNLDQYVDLIIPRGSNVFVRFVQQNTKIPVLGHADGICHLYIDRAADMEMAIALTIDAKTSYPSACNTIETLLVHRDIAPQLLPKLADALQTRAVELRGDAETQHLLATHGITIQQVTDEDWKTEYSDLILAIKQVESVDEAIAHINTYGSRHTDGIVTQDEQVALTFMNQVDAAGVFHNCSTRFADGFRYGFGAEVGISTQKMPPRGPVGMEGLVTYKYWLTGEGHVSTTYSGPDARPFTHRDL
ncbi:MULTISPECIES: glutamate-5-semialdehyde dehydrogenase [unclassified Leptolyngbya]|uniref:glutamate-5-semialdehyde dehydrogenase n=1 Tax=unclassified Leptolyngbya TaxID=2650499 RepID=UPI001686D135|nr:MULTISPECIES: glutamate-5-semialdehyde dehydrogenase [unclassified Leptolyngbya]MBD1911192.1 glutamate-5-semialdehyde dehydrogenase [Leptolyngbya sp. FACHB-8]MBD2155439.1 glutamate-5-semialdehyde dehydrogenase [Leptolyngbya sp. FACHB-16]